MYYYYQTFVVCGSYGHNVYNLIVLISLIKHNRLVFYRFKEKKNTYGHFGPVAISVPLGRPGMSARNFFRFYEIYFPDFFLHLTDLFNEYLCFYRYLKQLFFFFLADRAADIPVPHNRQLTPGLVKCCINLCRNIFSCINGIQGVLNEMR